MSRNSFILSFLWTFAREIFFLGENTPYNPSLHSKVGAWEIPEEVTEDGATRNLKHDHRFLGSMDLGKGFDLVHSPSYKDRVPVIIGFSFVDLDDHSKLRINMCSKDMLDRL